MLDAAREHKIGRFLYTSSACIYPGYKQNTTDGGIAQGRGRLSGPRTAARALRRAHVPALPRGQSVIFVAACLMAHTLAHLRIAGRVTATVGRVEWRRGPGFNNPDTQP